VAADEAGGLGAEVVTMNFAATDTGRQSHQVDVSFVGPPPVRTIERASGVRDVQAEGRMVRCVVDGSFQPFLEALRGYEVLTLQSAPSTPRIEGDL
jgi:hypothetical protein